MKSKILIGIAIILGLVINFWAMTTARSEFAWILCQPESFVNVRMRPSGRSTIIGRYDCGYIVETDGVKKNGFIHCINMALEMDEGWIAAGYIVYDEPQYPRWQDTTIQSDGRVACRKTINGDRKCWLNNGDRIKVYRFSSEWAITNKGYVKTAYVDLGQ